MRQGGLAWLTVPAGEASKSLQAAHTLLEQLGSLTIDRKTAIVAVGGGVVGDLAGFVASVYLRGLPFVQVPTSLVAMVDSSLGGKVGVDVPWGKNLVGSFWPAVLILTDAEMLKTLPEAEWSAGMAEAIKHAILDGPEHFSWLEKVDIRGLAERRELIERSAQVKMRHVLADPYEQGIRAHLNLGHTLAHALETAHGYQGLNHGQAVSLGLIAALRLSRLVGTLHDDFEWKLVQLLRTWQLPICIPREIHWDVVEGALAKDKKNQAGVLRYVLPEGLGAVQVRGGVPLESVRKVFTKLRCAS
jgi:3-dehydroquinate synthase